MHPATRGRARLNGQAEIKEDAIVLSTEEVYGNCPKYIQKTELEHTTRPTESNTVISQALSATDKAFIEKAHTFFIASAHPTGKADVSHRGGQAGFVHVACNELRFPDYAGNQMFNTLGNIQTNPKVGLLFVDFTTGDVLQLSGKAKVLWDEADYTVFSGAERAVSVTIEEVRYSKNTLGLRGGVLEFSPHNP